MIFDNPFEPDESTSVAATDPNASYAASQAHAATEHIYINFPYTEMPELSKTQEIYLNHLMCCGDIAAAALYTGISPLQTMTWSLNHEYLCREMQVTVLLGMMATDKMRYVGMYGNCEAILDKNTGQVIGHKRVRDTRLLGEVARNFDRRWGTQAAETALIEASSQSKPRVGAPTPSGFLPTNGR